ncbi:hypothetical protein ACS0TY_004853 [Phlomoides rotata]
MAYASLVSLQQTTNLILDHLHKYSISVDEREKIKAIREHVNFLIPFLENFPEKAHRLEEKIRDLANEAEDVIELFMWNQFHRDWSVGLSRGKFESQLKRVREKIGSITGDLIDDRLCNLPAAISSSGVAASGKNDVVIGLDEDLLAMKDRLCGSSKLEVIPIIGMGGIGKTTLARYAYNDSLIREYFHIRAFVQVSQDFSAEEFLQKLLASIKLSEEKMLGEKKESGIAENVCNESVIAEKVYKRLKGRKYLIVVDDIWSTKAWDDVRNIFPDDKNGSRIMLTTRLSDVATYASSGSPLHGMKFKDENQSWYLLKQTMITYGEDCPPELEDIAKDIARTCRGLPLAVVLVAGILSTAVKTQASWEKIAKNVNSVVDGQVDKILSLSYRLLPHHLRSCFLFMAGYPEDHKIKVSRLIKLWVAEGFLKRQRGHKSLEEEAEEYLEDLVKRSLVLITSRKSNGKIKRCSLHDLVRDMCIRKAQEEKFLVTDKYVLPNGRKDERRISIGHSSLNEIRSPTIHTILCFAYFLDCSSIVNFRLLRVLEVMHYSDCLPPQVFELFHLRYLALPFVHKIPAAISNLENLQTLIICSGKPHLPLEIWRLRHLRHLIFASTYALPIPAECRIWPTLPLENLHTLTGISDFVYTKRILKLMPNLKKLGFSTTRVQSLHNLANLHQLEKLKITVSRSFSWQGPHLAFPTTLKKLTLFRGRLPWKDMSIVGSLPNLQVLKLKDNACDGDTWETSYGEFPQLKFLLIEGSNLEHWVTEKDHFPRLERLVLHICWSLREIPDSIGEISTLELIKVGSVRSSLMESVRKIQEDQQSYGNDALHVVAFKQIRHFGYAS